jgi:hypothetical protein
MANPEYGCMTHGRLMVIINISSRGLNLAEKPGFQLDTARRLAQEQRSIL